MSSAFFSALKLLFILAVVSSAVLSLQTNNDLGDIFRPYRSRNVISSEKETSRNGVSKLVPENQKKVDCYRRGGYRTGGGIPPVIIIGGGGGSGAIPGMVIPGAAGGAGGGGVPATGSGGSAPGPSSGTSGGGAGTGDATTVPTA